STRIDSPDAEYSRQFDDLQHRKHAPAVRNTHEGNRQKYLAIRSGNLSEADGFHSCAMAEGSSGHLLWRQRYDHDAPPDARFWRNVSPGRKGQRDAGSSSEMD